MPVNLRKSRAKPRDIEGPIHRSILDYLRLALPDALIHHSPNAIGLSGYKLSRQIAENRENGTVKGFPDLIVLPWANIGPMLFEVKAPGNYPDKDQRELHERLTTLGYRVAVVRSPEDVAAKLDEWGIWQQPGARKVVLP
ncbi:VRR-NUC domain-containing protein [Pseudogemmobacter faecipullorum]|uniref:VRR-NUC domain-containing protein n=1 Tax=Pseudogemmobacter faecipullorum TaxID=2755041 RepID=A0ABS8CQX2_9RHOB|nr:VRR-NUC domain-containing protein [Pseudogemmobacter faecipullorum]MCB5411804.1 VRR-NUC domain-containing protein [Pseudogemmobacter faecipullorum]